jgi:hypothetical protein
MLTLDEALKMMNAQDKLRVIDVAELAAMSAIGNNPA